MVIASFKSRWGTWVYYYCYYYSNMHLKGNQSLKQHSVSHPEQRLYFGMSGTFQKYTLFGLLEPTSSMSILCASGPNVNTYCTGPPTAHQSQRTTMFVTRQQRVSINSLKSCFNKLTVLRFFRIWWHTASAFMFY